MSNIPIGFKLTFKLLETYGDLYYIGLNTLQVYNQKGEALLQSNSRIDASPWKDMRSIDNNRTDTRILSNLLNPTKTGWLVPFANHNYNR